MDIIIDGEKYLNLEEILKITGIKQTELYGRMKYGDFPKPEYKKIRALWKKSVIEEYIESKRK
jgi:predicted DNA-binding transcriptional regulator AlpA